MNNVDMVYIVTRITSLKWFISLYLHQQNKRYFLPRLSIFSNSRLTPFFVTFLSKMKSSFTVTKHKFWSSIKFLAMKLVVISFCHAFQATKLVPRFVICTTVYAFIHILIIPFSSTTYISFVAVTWFISFSIWTVPFAGVICLTRSIW